jgi:hypothetical protein
LLPDLEEEREGWAKGLAPCIPFRLNASSLIRIIETKVNADTKADMRLKKWLPTVEILRNFFLQRTDMISFFQQLREAF